MQGGIQKIRSCKCLHISKSSISYKCLHTYTKTYMQGICFMKSMHSMKMFDVNNYLNVWKQLLVMGKNMKTGGENGEMMEQN